MRDAEVGLGWLAECVVRTQQPPCNDIRSTVPRDRGRSFESVDKRGFLGDPERVAVGDERPTNHFAANIADDEEVVPTRCDRCFRLKRLEEIDGLAGDTIVGHREGAEERFITDGESSEGKLPERHYEACYIERDPRSVDSPLRTLEQCPHRPYGPVRRNDCAKQM